VAATYTKQEHAIASAEQAGLRRRSTIRQQEHGSHRFFLLQVRQYLLDDHRVFDTGNDLNGTAAFTARFDVNSRLFLPLP
jgi:hypothetical protein